MSWAEEVGRALLALGVPWLPGMCAWVVGLTAEEQTAGDRYVWTDARGRLRFAGPGVGAMPMIDCARRDHSKVVPDLRDDATRGAVRGWLSDRVGEHIAILCTEKDNGRLPWVGSVRSGGGSRLLTIDNADWREAEARALLSMAREVLA